MVADVIRCGGQVVGYVDTTTCRDCGIEVEVSSNARLTEHDLAAVVCDTCAPNERPTLFEIPRGVQLRIVTDDWDSAA